MKTWGVLGQRRENTGAGSLPAELGRIPGSQWEGAIRACVIKDQSLTKHSCVPDAVPNASMPYPISTSQQPFEVGLFPGCPHKEEREVLER